MSSQEEFEALSDAARDDRPLMSLQAVALRLGVSIRKVKQLIKSQGGLPPEIRSFKLDGLRKVEAAAVDEYVARLKGE